jgi:hypothetical protein
MAKAPTRRKKSAALPPPEADMTPLSTPDAVASQAIASGPLAPAPAPRPKGSRPRRRTTATVADAAPAPAPAPTPATSPAVGARVFQVFHEGWQKELLDPAFVALDQSRKGSELPELALPQALLQHKAIEGVRLWGLVSWRFTQTTGLSGQDLLRALEPHGEADVCHLHAAPEQEGLFHNAWVQAETEHPGLLEIARALLKAAELPTEDLGALQHAQDYAPGTVVIGTRDFWLGYVAFLQRLVGASKKLEPQAQAQLYANLPHEHGLGGQTSLLGVMLRLVLPLYLKTEGTAFKAHKLALPAKERALNVHQQLLKEMKDVAHRTHSTWLAACWVNYRNLYLNQTQGKAWCQKHLRNITPTEIRFG